MYKTNKEKTMSLVVGGIYLFLLVWIIVFKLNINFAEMDHIRSLNLIPFKESMIVNGQLELSEIIYNILVFVPLGIYTSILKKDWAFAKKILPALCFSILFETIQYVFAIGASDITDVIGNTLGGIIGIGVFSFFEKIFRNKAITIVNMIGLIVEIFAIIILVILLVANM